MEGGPDGYSCGAFIVEDLSPRAYSHPEVVLSDGGDIEAEVLNKVVELCLREGRG